ncbi:MAG: helicase IV, partial [Verrucomicrobiae bacterium]|nr:helicase IV [Verrucomicrobiae bacterium]
MDNDRYQEKMQWAREIHAKHGTCLVETYSWEKMDGVLLSNLERKLTANGVVLGMQSIEKAVADLHAEGEVDPFVALAGSFLSLYKGSGVSMSELHYRVQQLPNSTRYSLFLDLFAPCYEEYEARLRSNDEIDFEDMISRALEVIKSGKDGTHYKYIVIDEFQDIGSGRAALIKELRNKVPGCKLFCVGDDWQSIFRFAGSDISLMTRFDAHFGYTRKALLEKTFRFNSKIAEFSNHFILKNRYQLSKILKTVYASEGPDVLIHWRDNASDPVRLILADLAYSGPAKVFLLTRYAFQVDTSLLRSYRSAFPMLEIEALTVHKSKGLEADYVIIDRLCGGKFGFPSEMVDDAVLDLVLPEADQCSHGEERRLFYVALTRARKQVHLIAEAEMESVFVQEILTDPVYDLGEWVSEKDALRSERPLSSFACPSCRRGHLTLRREVGASFFCCSNSPICDYHMSVCPNCRKGCLLPKGEGVVQCQMCGHEARVCPECGEGVLIERANRRDGSLFNGCSRWRKGGKGCTYTE